MEVVNYRAFKEGSQGAGTGENIIKYIKGVTTMVGYLISITIRVVNFSMLSQSMAHLWTSQSYWTQKNCTLEKIYLLRSYISLTASVCPVLKILYRPTVSFTHQ